MKACSIRPLLLLSLVFLPHFLVEGRISQPSSVRSLQSSNLADVQSALDDARNTWDSLNVTDYKLGFTRRCFCEEAFRTPTVSIVSNNTLIRVQDQRTSAELAVEGESWFQSAFTVESMYDFIQSAIDRSAFQINVTYHPLYKHITEYSIDFEEMLMDEERRVEVDYMLPISLHLEELRAQNLIWDATTGTSSTGYESYSYVLTRSCECLESISGPHTIQIINGELYSINGQLYDPTTNATPDMPRVPSYMLPISDFFVFIAQQVENIAYFFAVRYDATLGYPRTITVDYNRFIADEELILSIRDLTETSPEMVEELLQLSQAEGESDTPAPIQAPTDPIRQTEPPVSLTAGVQERLTDARALWNSFQITNYEMGFQRLGFIQEDFRTPTISIVQDGVVVRAQNAETMEDWPAGQLVSNAYTVESIFELVQSALDQDAYQIDIQFNATYGFVTFFDIDYDVQIADEERSAEIQFVDFLLNGGAGDPIPGENVVGTPAPVIDPTAAPVPAPTRTPTNIPTSAPTITPTIAPTNTPTADPTMAPTLTPTSAPIPNPTMAPAFDPTAGPTMSPADLTTNAPISNPTDASVPDPTESPITQAELTPSAAPVASPTQAPVISTSSNSNAAVNEQRSASPKFSVSVITMLSMIVATICI